MTIFTGRPLWMSPNDVHTLEISKFTLKDVGSYQVKAINSEGEAKCSAIINIVPAITNHSPAFLRLFNDQRTSIGSTIKFDALLTGTKPLNVK